MENSTAQNEGETGGGQGPTQAVAELAPPPEGTRERHSHCLLEHVSRGLLGPPTSYHGQKAFYRFLRRASSDREILEEVRRLRDAIMVSTVRDEKARTGGFAVGLAGVNGGEGASFVSLLLALSLGESRSRRVAVLDCRSSEPRFLLLSDMLGLSGTATGLRETAKDVVGCFNPSFPNVCFLRSRTAEGTALLTDRRLGGFLTDMRRYFDFTLVDLPPILKDASGAFVLPNLDRLYLVTEASKTRLADVTKCVSMVREAGGPVSGAIVNKQRAPLWSRLLWRDFFF